MAATQPASDGRSPTDPSSSAGPTNSQLASLLNEAYRELDDLRDRARQEKERADYWQRIAETSGDRQIQILQKEVYDAQCQRDVERARRVAMTDQWHQLRDYLNLLDAHSRDARLGLDKLFSMKGGVVKELETQPIPLVSDVNTAPRARRDVSQKKRKRDTSPSPSIDEMILEAADHSQSGLSEPFPHPPSVPLAGAPTMPVPLSSSITSTRPTTGSFQTHIFAPVVTGAPTKRAKYSSTGQIASSQAGASSSHLNNGTTGPRTDTSAGEQSPAKIWPATNAAGQRICRCCGETGRYKDDKCIEKWGPGPMGPGTVCDRCRKKMKRVERRSTMTGTPVPQLAGNNMPQAATHITTHTHTQPQIGRMALPLVKPSHQSSVPPRPLSSGSVVPPSPSKADGAERYIPLPTVRVIQQSSPGSGSDADGDADDDDTVNEEGTPPTPLVATAHKDAPPTHPMTSTNGQPATVNGHVSAASDHLAESQAR